MASIKIKVDDRVSAKLSAIPKNLNRIAYRAYQFFVAQTPVRSGNARRNTDFVRTNSGGTIHADYPYAERLDEGYSSQAPQGMTKPTLRYIRAQVRRAVRGR